jgi:3-mercaptopyruvate sulfurtransferase SseA
VSVIRAERCSSSHLHRQSTLGFSAHLPQARYFDQLECTTPTKQIPRGLPEIKCFEAYLSRLGITNDHHIVLYDRSPMGFYASSRAWWVFKVSNSNRFDLER